MSPSLLTRGFNELESVIAKTMEYLSIPSVVGYETIFLNYLRADFEKLGLQVIEYDGLLEVSGTAPLQAIVCAHIDRHGLVSIGDDEYAYAAQYVREIKYGENHNSSRKELENIADRFEGESVYAYDPKTGAKLGEGIIKPSYKAMENGDSIFFIEGFEHFETGTPIAYGRTARAKSGKLRGQIDNTLSIGVVYALFKAGYQGTAYLTTEEEIGKSWIHISSHLERENIETQELLVIDTSPYLDDDPLDEGALIFRTRDRFAEFNGTLTEKLATIADSLDMPFHVKDQDLLAAGKCIDSLGSTELGRLISEQNGRWSGTSIQVPTNMYHTSSETTSKLAIKNYFRFLKHILIKDPIELDIKKS